MLLFLLVGNQEYAALSSSCSRISLEQNLIRLRQVSTVDFSTVVLIVNDTRIHPSNIENTVENHYWPSPRISCTCIRGTQLINNINSTFGFTYLIFQIYAN